MEIYNRFIPFKGFVAMNLFGVIFIRREYRYSNAMDYRKTMNHEGIHSEQMMDFAPRFLPRWMRLMLGGVVFYILYLLEWLYRLMFHTKSAYRGISFEREAYEHQDEFDYIVRRKRFAQWI